mgnify:CR=1 FL=1
MWGLDVSLLGGLRGGLATPLGPLDGEIATGVRHNFLFQNTAVNHTTAAGSAVDVRNTSFRLTFTPRLRRAPSRPPPADVPVITPVVTPPQSTRDPLHEAAPPAGSAAPADPHLPLTPPGS